MKRITQILASILFIVTVLTVYLTFDFAINNAMSKKYSNDKYDRHEHIHDDINSKKTSVVLPLLKAKTTNQTLANNSIINQERRIRNPKQKQQLAKPAQFHKSKTGIKVNQIKKSTKEQRKRLLLTKTMLHTDIKPNGDKIHL